MADNHNPLAGRVHQLREALSERDPEQMAAQTGTCLEQDPAGQAYFHFPYWGDQIIYPVDQYLACRAGDSEPLQVIDQAMIAYYFHDSAGSPPAAGWMSFSELPDGQFYNSAFQGYTARKLQSGFGSEYGAFENSCLARGGEPVEFASLAFRFQVLPRVAVLAACWKGDEEFPPSYQILFNNTVSCHLPTDACAILGSMLTGKLLPSSGPDRKPEEREALI